MQDSSSEMTFVCGYYNPMDMPLNLRITELGINMTLGPKKYLVNKEGEAINDSILDRYVGPNKLAKAEGKKPVKLVRATRPSYTEKSTNSQSFAGSTKVKVDDHGRVTNVPVPVSPEQRAKISSKAVAGFSMEEARKLGLIASRGPLEDDIKEAAALQQIEAEKNHAVIERHRQLAEAKHPPLPPPLPAQKTDADLTIPAVTVWRAAEPVEEEEEMAMKILGEEEGITLSTDIPVTKINLSRNKDGSASATFDPVTEKPVFQIDQTRPTPPAPPAPPTPPEPKISAEKIAAAKTAEKDVAVPKRRRRRNAAEKDAQAKSLEGPEPQI